MRCQKCQFWCDNQDAFCRKCGAPLAEEGVYQEQLDQNAAFVHDAELTIGSPTLVNPSVEVTIQPNQTDHTALAISNPVTTSLEPSHPKTGLKSKMLGLAAKTLGSEEGRAVIKGAAVLAVSVGMELLNHNKQKAVAKPTDLALPENFSPASLPELVELASPLASGTTIVETWMYRYTYTRRVVRRVR